MTFLRQIAGAFGVNVAGDVHGDVTIGYTVAEHEAALKTKVAAYEARLAKTEANLANARTDHCQSRADIERAHQAELRRIRDERETLRDRLADLPADHERTVAELKATKAKLQQYENQLDPDARKAAYNALDHGDRSRADALFAELERQLHARANDALAEAAEIAMMRGDIAEADIRWADAVEHFQRAISLCPSLGAYTKASDMLCRIGRADQALGLDKAALDLAHGAYGPRSRETANTLNNLACSYIHLGEPGEAVPLFWEVLDIGEEICGAGDPWLANMNMNFAHCLFTMGWAYEAEKRQRQALDILRVAYSEPNREVARAAGNLAGTLQRLGRHEFANPDRRVVSDEASAGLDGPELFHRRYAEAEMLLLEALRIDSATIGTQHPDYANDLSHVAHLLKDLGRMNEAEQLFRQVVGINEAALGKVHPVLAKDLNNLALFLVDCGRVTEALPLLALALEINLNCLGRTHAQSKRHARHYADLLRRYFPEDPTLAELEAAFGVDIGLLEGN